MKIVGHQSPFNKVSPLKNPGFLGTPAGQQLAMSVAPGVITAIGSLFGSRRRKRQQAEARARFNEAKRKFESIEYKNYFENVKNPFEGLQNPYAENVYEDLTVNTQAADYLMQQQQQQQANTLQALRGVGGGSGAAGLAQSLANIAAKQQQVASASIAEQERKNQLLVAKGEQMKAKGEFDLQRMQQKGAFDVDMIQRQGQARADALENQRTESLLGLAADKLSASNAARAQARSQFFSGLGQAATGVIAQYAPGGLLYNDGK